MIRVLQEQTVRRGETLAEEMKASQEKSASQASELHAKEVEVLQNQVDKLKQELSSSKDKSEELAKSVSELQSYKEQAQVRSSLPFAYFYFIISKAQTSI